MKSVLLNELAEIGCDIAIRLEETYMGMEDLFVQILGQLPESTALDRIRTATAAGDARACFEAAHELKGLYATLGLTPAGALCSEIVEIVRPCAGVDGVAEILARLVPLHERILAIVRASGSDAAKGGNA